MAELLVFTTDTVGDDVYKNAKLPKRGDVITIQKDGWPWADGELKEPRFLILKLPGVAVSDLSSLISHEVSAAPSNDPGALQWIHPTNTLQYRGFHLDLDSLQVAYPNIVAPVVSQPVKGGMQPVSVAPAPVQIPDAASLLAYKTKRPAIADPAIIGAPTNVLG